VAATKTLEMHFTTELNKNQTVRVADVRDDVTAEEIGLAMDNIISKNIFSTTGGDLNGKLGARIVTRDVTTVNLA
jgi:hypothetical protein